MSNHEPIARRDTAGQAILHAWGAYLQGFVWHHMATLTFGIAPSCDTADRALQSWVRRLARNAQRQVACFYSIERSGSGFLHVHALTVGTSDLSIEQLKAGMAFGNHPHRRV